MVRALDIAKSLLVLVITAIEYRPSSSKDPIVALETQRELCQVYARVVSYVVVLLLSDILSVLLDLISVAIIVKLVISISECRSEL